MQMMKDISRNDIIRLVALGVVVLLEGLAVLSLIFKYQFFSLGGAYANIISVAVFVLPFVVGVLSHRLTGAVFLATLPFLISSAIYLGFFGDPFNIDLFQLGVLAGRVAAIGILLAFLATLGWVARRATFDHEAVA
jgi:hypothetical protein